MPSASEQPSRAMISHFFLTGALALADPEGARTALSAATGRAEANALARHDIPLDRCACNDR